MGVRAAVVAGVLGVTGGAGTSAVVHRGDGLDPARETAALALNAGLTPEQAVIATAIAFGESNHRDAAEGDTTITDGTWGPSLGRWQIRCYWADIGTGRERDCSRLADPQFNAHSMFVVSGGGQNWRPWSVYLHGVYEQFLPDARRAVNDVTGGGVEPVAYFPKGGSTGPQVERTPGRLAANVWRFLVDGWVSLGRTSDPAVRDRWSDVDRGLFGDVREPRP